MCGTDGVTYDNICALRSTAANVRADYMGECVDPTEGETVEAVCERVRQDDRCTYNSDNCDFPVEPEDGCCPICGKYICGDITPVSKIIKVPPAAIKSCHSLLV